MFKIITENSTANIKNDVLSGLTVALALVPEAVAFAILAHLPAIVGLYAAFTIGLVAAIIGGRPGMISGATGAIAVVIGTLVLQHGAEYLFAAVVVMGAIQILFGALKLGKFIRLVPHPVFLGFVNGLAMVIFISQLEHFKIELPDGTKEWITGSTLYIMLALIALTMAIIKFLPRLTTFIPSTLAAIIIGTLITLGLSHYLNIDTRSVGDIESIKGTFPPFHIPNVPFNWETLQIVFPYAIIMALVGLIESLLTLNLIDELTESQGQPNRECIGQGVANTVTGVFGGMGGCAMVGQSIINIRSGGRGRLSGISAALFLLLFIMQASELIEQIPIAVLVGVMFMVVIGTFEWSSFRLFGKVPIADIFIGISVALITVVSDNLALAVIIGVILSALVFAWNHAKEINVTTRMNKMGDKVYELHGPLFFASVHNFQ
ncbi:MAG TPA: SulP family inorganic anion transporter, partial [Leucothrix mucor]|nr:SulP family inorganic anion transporter [Leucothrix mucor]